MHPPTTPRRLSEEEFQVNVSAVAEKLLEKDKNLNEQTDRFWTQLTNGSFDFDKRKHQAAAVRSCTLAAVKSFFDAHFAIASP